MTTKGCGGPLVASILLLLDVSGSSFGNNIVLDSKHFTSTGTFQCEFRVLFALIFAVETHFVTFGFELDSRFISYNDIRARCIFSS